ncbi:MAG: SIS domain-containing protein [Thermorudis peleae]|nr:SIS domain-containing protein [Thermorudis peleae]
MGSQPEQVPQSSRSTDYQQWLAHALAARRYTISQALQILETQSDHLAIVVAWIVQSLQRGNKVLVAGNGGSAAAAQHLAAELVGRFRCNRSPLPALALTADTALMTALANDFGYHQVFMRQIQALAHEGDVLVLFSTSGRSESVLEAARAARSRGVIVIAFVGGHPSPLHHIAHITLSMPSNDTPVVQELHTVVTHLVCELVERELSERAQ